MDAETVRSRLGMPSAWERRADGWWMEDPHLDVEEMARVMSVASARLATITARPTPGGECRLAYHWDLDGQLLTVVTWTHEGSLASIAGLCPAADWIEREIHDYYAVVWIGREAVPPLMLRPGDQPGIFHPNGGAGQ